MISGKVHVVVKPNASKSEILSYDKDREIWKIAIKEQAIDGKANAALVKFLRKETKKDVCILKGQTSRNKIVMIE